MDISTQKKCMIIYQNYHPQKQKSSTVMIVFTTQEKAIRGERVKSIGVLLRTGCAKK